MTLGRQDQINQSDKMTISHLMTPNCHFTWFLLYRIKNATYPTYHKSIYLSPRIRIFRNKYCLPPAQVKSPWEQLGRQVVGRGGERRLDCPEGSQPQRLRSPSLPCTNRRRGVSRVPLVDSSAKKKKRACRLVWQTFGDFMIS